MALIGDALRQAFMPKHEYESLREEDKAWTRLQRPFLILALTLICLVIVICIIVSLKIVFPSDYRKRPFCSDMRLQPLPVNVKGGGRDSDLFEGAFYLTDQETVDYYWMVLFIPTTIILLASVVYLVAGITVAYTAPRRHGCLNVVENIIVLQKGLGSIYGHWGNSIIMNVVHWLSSFRGGVHCLSILNAAFAIIFSLLALFLGSSLLTLGSSCSVPLFWCYEISSWGLVILYAGTSIFLRRKAVVILDENDFGSRNLGLEMLEANPLEVTPDVERHVNEGFKAWMGSSLLSSDEEVEPDNHEEVPLQLTHTSSNRQRV